MQRSIFVLAGWLVLGLVAGFGVACDKGGEGGDDDIAWPERPADGCPVAFQFIELVGEGDSREAKFHLFNFEAKNVQSIGMTLHYLNDAGEEIDSFPWGATAPALVAANNHVVVEAGAFLPAETTSVNVSVDTVTFTDGSTWSSGPE